MRVADLVETVWVLLLSQSVVLGVGVQNEGDCVPTETMPFIGPSE